MKVVTEITIIIQKGQLPGFIQALYNKKCEVQSLRIVEENKNEELYKIEVIYLDRNSFKDLIVVVTQNKEKYRILSVINTLEKNIEGGLIQVCGKMPLENLNDYEMNLIGATELIIEKINENVGAQYIGIDKNIALINGVKYEEEIEQVFLEKAHICSEADSVLINRFTGLNAYPLTVTYTHVEDFSKTLSRIENSFSIIKINEIDDYDLSVYEHLYSELKVPVVSKWLDDVPLCLLVILFKLMNNNTLKSEETNVGFIGLDISSLRLTRLMKKIGIARILGNDIVGKLILDFENQGGLGTTNENIFSNSDILIILKNNFTDEEMQKIRPGQFIISMLNEDDMNMEIVANKGIRECIHFKKSHLTSIFPGLIKGMIHYGKGHLNDEMIISSARKIEEVMLDNYMFPDVFSDIHNTIAEIIHLDE